MSALALKLLALVCMTLDHIGIFVPRLSWLRSIGRVAFPLYAFLLTEGFRFSRNRGRYALRLGIFALISQIPFSLISRPGLLRETDLPRKLLYEFLHHGNVMLSLLTALLCLWLLDANRDSRPRLAAAALAVALVFVLHLLDIVHSDYGGVCILMALVFTYFRDRPALLAAGMLFAIFHGTLFSWGVTLLRLLLGRTAVFQWPTAWKIRQICAMGALIPILLYNGESGRQPLSKLGRKAAQLGFYLYYPAHLLVLRLLFR